MGFWGRSVDEDTYDEIFERGRSEGFDGGVLEGLRRGGADEVLERVAWWSPDTRDSDILNLQSLANHIQETVPGDQGIADFLERIADCLEELHIDV